MKVYLAYFDILGFKEFMSNNTTEYFHKHIDHLFRESQNAVAKGKIVEGKGRGYLVPDLSNAEVNCMHFSDSIIFWTEDQSEKSFQNILDVCYIFNWRSIQTAFPLRGCLVAGEISFHPLQVQSNNGAMFYNSSIFGLALVNGYQKAESQDWAGCYVDQSALDLIPKEHIQSLVDEHKIIQYPVPFKDGSNRTEYAVCIMGGKINQATYNNMKPDVIRLFTQHMNGKSIAPSVEVKLENTLKFLHSFIAD